MIKTDIQIRFGDIDALRHVNNVSIVQYYDLGVSEYMRKVVKLANVFDGAGLAKVNVQMNFYDSIEMYDTIEVITHVSRIGNKSLTFSQEVREKNSGKLKSDCVTILAGFDVKERKSLEIPYQWKETIAEYENYDLNILPSAKSHQK